MALERDAVIIRMPAALKEVLTVQASAAMRSFNSEVLARLWSTLGESPAERLAAVESTRADSGVVKGPQLVLDGTRKGPKSAGTRKRPASKRKGANRG